jgi:UDP:flavonoid glycosyltransferase YjiC (YdhE family)
VRVLFASTQGTGHFGPLIPLIDACTRNGHETLIVGPPTLKARGYPFEAGDVPPEEVLGPLWGAMPSLPPAQGDVVVVGTIFGRLNVDAMLPKHHEVIEGWQPDLVVREGAEFASAIAAEQHGIPHVRVASSVSYVERGALAIAGPALDDRLADVSERIAASPFLTYFPPFVDPAPFDVTRLRHPASEAEAGPLPDWWPAGLDGPLVYVSFGSVAATFPPAAQVYARALEAVVDLPARVLLSTGGNDVELGDVPSNVHVERWVDEPSILGHAHAVVGHGGTGTTLSALAAGCPLVGVPLFGDQPMNVACVAAAHAGVVAPLDGIRRAIERVLTDDRYRAAARRAADEMRSAAAVDDFLEVVAPERRA